MINQKCETVNPLVVDAACGAGLSGLSRRSFSEDGSQVSAFPVPLIERDFRVIQLSF